MSHRASRYSREITTPSRAERRHLHDEAVENVCTTQKMVEIEHAISVKKHEHPGDYPYTTFTNEN